MNTDKLTWWQREPALIVSQTTAVLTLVGAFGIAKLTDNQTAAVLGIAAAIAQILGGAVTRSQVTPNSKTTEPAAYDDHPASADLHQSP